MTVKPAMMYGLQTLTVKKKKTGDGGGRVEGVKVFTERHQDGRDQK